MTRLKLRKVGSGITRHEQVSWCGSDPEARAEAEMLLGGYVDPRHDFASWVKRRKARIAEALSHFRQPAPDRFVTYEKGEGQDKPRNWKYTSHPTVPGQSRARTEWYLQEFPYQSSFWYYGRILFHINQCELQIAAGSTLSLAGHSLELGRVTREMELKFSGEKRIANFEGHVAASDRGNCTRKANALAWQGLVRKIVGTHPDIDVDNRTAAAKAILAKWPGARPKPSVSRLRRYLSDWQNGPSGQK